MPRKKKPLQDEPIPSDDRPRWSVVTDADGTHRLLYGKKIQERSTSTPGLERVRSIASHCNRRGIEPRDRIECVADRSEQPLRMPRRAAHPTASD